VGGSLLGLERHHGLAVESGLQVAARAEGAVAGSGEHRHVRLVVVAEALPRVHELAVGLGADRVHPLGTVDRDQRDRPVLLVGQVLVHGGMLA
jgi:hypothetical protein